MNRRKAPETLLGFPYLLLIALVASMAASSLHSEPKVVFYATAVVSSVLLIAIVGKKMLHLRKRASLSNK